MPDNRLDFRDFDFREAFPWLHLFRTVRIALCGKKIVLGAMGTVLMAAGWWAIAWLFVSGSPAPPDSFEESKQLALREARRLPWQLSASPVAGARLPPADEAAPSASGDATDGSADASEPQPARSTFALDLFRGLLQDRPLRGPEASAVFLTIDPVVRLTFPSMLMLQGTDSFFPGILLTGWTLAVWSLIGGAITRIAAVEIAREGRVGLFESLRYASRRYLSYFGAPVVPALGIAFMMGCGSLFGFFAGFDILNLALGLVWFIPLLIGWIAAILILGLTLSWPLMCPAISAESTACFDALSQSFSYLLGKPTHFFFYALVAALTGIVGIGAIVTFGYATVYLSYYTTSLGMGEETARLYYALAPEAGGWRAAFGPAAGGPTGVDYTTAVFISFWTHLLFLGLIGYVYSYFWSAATVMYFLLRRDVDAADIEEIFVDEEEDEPFPTISSTLSPPPGEASAAAPEPGTGGVSLPIIDPPH